MARLPDLIDLANQHDLRICSVAQVIEHRLQRETLVHRIGDPAGEQIDTARGPFRLIAYDSVVDALPHVALTLGMEGERFDHDTPTLVRMHQRNLLGDIFGVPSADGKESTDQLLRASMRMIQQEGRGALVYLRPEGVGDALSKRLLTIKRTAADPDKPDLTAPPGAGGGMPLREYGIGGQILRDLGLGKMRLLTNHPRTLPGLDAFGLEIVETTPIDLRSE
jgi:3,4-dihydroxy 2-butanone 4-phosphate synthase/GTP cyclohydrolase II